MTIWEQPCLCELCALCGRSILPRWGSVRRSGDSEAEDVTFVEYRQGAGVYPHVLVEVSHVGAEFDIDNRRRHVFTFPHESHAVDLIEKRRDTFQNIFERWDNLHCRRYGFAEDSPVALSGDPRVGHYHHATICLGTHETSKSLPETY